MLFLRIVEVKVSSPRYVSLFGSYIFALSRRTRCPCARAWSCGFQNKLLFDIPHQRKHAHALRNTSRPSSALSSAAEPPRASTGIRIKFASCAPIPRARPSSFILCNCPRRLDGFDILAHYAERLRGQDAYREMGSWRGDVARCLGGREDLDEWWLSSCYAESVRERGEERACEGGRRRTGLRLTSSNPLKGS